MRTTLIAAVTALALCSMTTHATDYDESTDGDLSGDRFNPTSLVFTEGVNTITNTSILNDLDYLTVTVPVDTQLGAITLTGFESVDDLAFIAIQEGPTFTTSAEAPDITALLGWAHIGPGADGVPVGGDLLTALGTSPQAIGFTGPLDAGVYTFWIQQASGVSSTHTFEFVVTSTIPVPGALALCAAAGIRTRRRRTH
ncbi:MAG: hypothetical protein AAF432_14785 [Planctomycetota bacterium]